MKTTSKTLQRPPYARFDDFEKTNWMLWYLFRTVEDLMRRLHDTGSEIFNSFGYGLMQRGTITAVGADYFTCTMSETEETGVAVYPMAKGTNGLDGNTIPKLAIGAVIPVHKGGNDTYYTPLVFYDDVFVWS